MDAQLNYWQRDPNAGGLSDLSDLDTSGLAKYLAEREQAQVTKYLDQVKPGPQLTPEQAAQIGTAPAHQHGWTVTSHSNPTM